jgi:hypothetical protein
MGNEFISVAGGATNLAMDFKVKLFLCFGFFNELIFRIEAFSLSAVYPLLLLPSWQFYHLHSYT